MNDPVLELISKVGLDGASKRLSIPRERIDEYILYLKSRDNAPFFAETFLRIRTKAGKLVPLKYNKGQRKILDAVVRQRAAGKPVRIKQLKARQFGGSTFDQSLFFYDNIFGDHLQFLTVCQDLDSAKNMRGMFSRFYENYPDTFGAELKKPAKKSQQGSDKWWRFPEKDSDYLIDTADEVDTGRSFTTHRLHASEVAFYRDPVDLMTALLQSVPDDPNTVVFIESTGNGIGDWFYNFINAPNEYELVFVGWWEIEEYTRPFENDSKKAALERDLDSYETTLKNRFHLTLEQLQWRRYTIANKLNGDEIKFQQEYPATPEEAFISSGRPYFPVTTVRNNLLKSEEITPVTGFFEWTKYGEFVDFIPDRNGWWKVFETPEEGWINRYVTGSDVAEGKTVKEASREPDNSTCRVFDRVKKKEVAAYCARIDTDLFADEIYKASVYYGSPCDCIERNSAGIAVNDALKHKENVALYQRELVAKTDEKETIEYGYLTTSGAGGGREIALSDLRMWIRQGLFLSDDAEFWRECLTFVYNDKGKPEGQRGCHDDRVFGAALAIQASLQAPLYRQTRRPVETRRLSDGTDIWEPERQESLTAEF